MTKEGRRQSLTSTYSHLSRKLKSTVRRDGKFPSDALIAENVEPVLCGQTGFPDSADSLAYDPIQGIVAVGTPDGRIKIVGRPGVEATLTEVTKSPTMWMAFLQHRGGLVRASQDGDIQLYSIAEQKCMASIWMEEAITDLAIVHGEHYLMVSCVSGSVKIIAITDAEGEVGFGPVADLQVQPYAILAKDIDGKGPVVAIASTKNNNRPLLVVVHRNSGAVVWDLRAEQIVASAFDDEDDPSKPTSVCWVGERGNCFAVGYDDGSVLIWGFHPLTPDAAIVAPQDAVLVSSIRLVPDGVDAAPVKALKYIAGNAGTPGGEDCLLVLGGQNAEDPDMLTLAPLEPSMEPKPVPWFGAIKSVALVPPSFGANASFEGHVRALLILTEGGRLVSYDLLDWQPAPLTVPVQELPPATTARFVPTLSDEQLLSVQGGASDGDNVVHALSLEKLRVCSNRNLPVGGQLQRREGRDSGPFDGGRKSAMQGTAACGHPAGLLLTGHRDGRLRAWDATAEVPTLMATVPPSDAGQERFRAVTTFEACPLSGMVAVGHIDGDVRLYQFSDRPQMVRLTSLDESLVPYDTLSHQPAGFQYVLTYSCHSTDSPAIALATSLKLVAIADAAGKVSVLDLAAPSQLFTVQAMTQPIAQIALGGQMLPTPDGEVERIVLFVVGQDSSCCALSLQNGEPVGRTLKPKNASKPLTLALLDEGGMPILPMHGHITLPWAENNALSVPPPRAPLPRIRTDTSGDPTNPFGPIIPEDSLEMRELPFDEDGRSPSAYSGMESPDTATKKKKRFGLFRRKSKSPKKDKKGGNTPEMSPSMTPDGMSPSKTEDGGGSFAAGSPDPKHSFDARSAMDKLQIQDTSSPMLPVEESLVEYPYLELLGSEPSVAAYVLLCTTDYLRLYSTESIYLGDRTTDRKAKHANGAVLSSRVFRSFNGPGVVSLAANGSLLVHSIPNLQSLYAQNLADDASLGFAWSPCEEASVGGLNQAGADTKAACVAACSLDGQLFLSGAGNEVLRIAVVRDAVVPKAPLSLYDWDLAGAHLRNRKEESRASRYSEAEQQQQQPSQQNHRQSLLPAKPLPSLNDLFEKEVVPLDDVDYWVEELDGPGAAGKGTSPSRSRSPSPNRSKSPAAKATAALSGGASKVAAILPGRRGSKSGKELSEVQKQEELLGARQKQEVSEGNRRAELLGARRTTPTGKPPPLQKRTKSEIGRVYGHTRAQDAKSTMEQNQRMLAERGQKLKGIEEKGAKLQSDAEDFAGMAQELEQLMAAKGKWWKF